MDLTEHTLRALFEQLGLPSSIAAIDGFIAEHRGLSEDIRLADAPFWTKAQAQFLREEFEEDAEWIEVIDQLNVRLRT